MQKTEISLIYTSSNILSARGSNVSKMNISLSYLLSLIISHNTKRLHPSDLDLFIFLMVFQTTLVDRAHSAGLLLREDWSDWTCEPAKGHKFEEDRNGCKI